MLTQNEKESTIKDMDVYFNSTFDQGYFDLLKTQSAYVNDYFGDEHIRYCNQCISKTRWTVYNGKKQEIKGGKRRILERDYTVDYIDWIPCIHDEDEKYSF